MEQRVVYGLLEQNITKIFAYCMSRVRNRTQAEDLANDIVVEVLRSADRLRCDDAFFGFLWTIASRVCRRYQRKEQPLPYDETYMGAIWHGLEDDVVHMEDLCLLRRELSLLSRQHRQVTVLHYFHGQSCAQIANALGFSADMVKYYLSVSRRKLKEGISMSRQFGEKSYHPSTFRLDAWTHGTTGELFHVFDRQLPGNILLAAYEQPSTVTQLSLELGVAAAYLEDELKILEDSGFIKPLPGGKYQTNIVILQNEEEQKFNASVKALMDNAAQELYTQLLAVQTDAQKIINADFSQIQFLWTLTTVAMYQAIELSDQKLRDRFGEYPLLSNGAHGFVYGYDNDYKNHHFNGINGHCENHAKTAYICALNFRIGKEHCNLRLRPWNESLEAITAACLTGAADASDATVRLLESGYISVQQGRLKANFPVFTKGQLVQLEQLLLPASQKITDFAGKICERAGKAFQPLAPAVLKGQMKQIMAVKYHTDTVGMLVESMLEQGYLSLGAPSEKYGIYGVLLK